MLALSPDMAPVETCLVSAPGKVILHGEHAVVHGKVKGPIKHTSLTGAARTSIMLQVWCDVPPLEGALESFAWNAALSQCFIYYYLFLLARIWIFSPKYFAQRGPNIQNLSTIWKNTSLSKSRVYLLPVSLLSPNVFYSLKSVKKKCIKCLKLVRDMNFINLVDLRNWIRLVFSFLLRLKIC